MIAQQTDLQTASGAVILAALLYFLIVPIFKRFLRYFPSLVIGVMLILVAINLAQISGKLIAGAPGSPDFGSPVNLLMAFITIASTLLFSRLLRGTSRQLTILLGLLVGAFSSALMGLMSIDQVSLTPLLAAPTPFPFGSPKFNLIAATPLLIFTLISMVEATGQTVALNEVLGKKPNKNSSLTFPRPYVEMVWPR